MVKDKINTFTPRILRIARVHFALTFIWALAIVLLDAWNYITPEVVLQRWTMAAILLVVTTIVWYSARTNLKSQAFYSGLIVSLVGVDIALATFMVYTERGMASRGVALYALPIVTSALLLRRSAIFATAAICTAAYSLAAVRYFVVNFNEGLNIELYETIAFYSALFFVLAAIIWIVLTPDRQA